MAIRYRRASGAPIPSPTRSGHTKPAPSPESPAVAVGVTASRVRRRHHLLRSLLLCSTAIMLPISTGCTLVEGVHRFVKNANFLDDFMIAHRNQTMAAKAWYREQAQHCDHPYLKEFKEGFIQGYIDVANGGDGCTPAIAPSQYWGWRYQSSEGQAAINAWFAGYPLGAKAAEQDGVGNWASIMTMGRPLPTEADTGLDPQVVQPVPYPVGPDGLPVPTERIVPGSEVIEPFEEAGEAIEDSIESLVPPAGGPMPEASLQPPERTLGTSSQTDQGSPVLSGPAVGSSLGQAATAGDRAEAVQLSLSDESTLVPQDVAPPPESGELGDEAIEGIFGTADQDAHSEIIETADAESAIPFKFE